MLWHMVILNQREILALFVFEIVLHPSCVAAHGLLARISALKIESNGRWTCVLDTAYGSYAARLGVF